MQLLKNTFLILLCGLAVSSCFSAESPLERIEVEKLTSENINAFLNRRIQSLKRSEYESTSIYFAKDLKIESVYSDGEGKLVSSFGAYRHMEWEMFRSLIWKPNLEAERSNTVIKIEDDGQSVVVEEDYDIEYFYLNAVYRSKIHRTFEIKLAHGLPLVYFAKYEYYPGSTSYEVKTSIQIQSIILICLSTLCIVILGRHLQKEVASRLMVLIVLGGISAFIWRITLDQMFPHFIWRRLLIMFYYITTYFMVVLSKVLFIEHFKLGRRHLGLFLLWAFFIVGIYYVFYIVMTSDFTPYSGSIFSGFRFLLVGSTLSLHLYSIWIILKEWKTDLVEKRREFRFVILLLVLLYTIFKISVSLITGFYLPPFWDWTNVVLIIILVYFIYRIARLDRDFFNSLNPPQPNGNGKPKTELKDPFFSKLDTYMNQTKSFHYERFTINYLAGELQIQEYKLRRLINRNLGYRNFNEFVNDYRIRDTVFQLTETDKPILNIALDVGYRNMSTFHKAFKERHGITPNQYRLQHQNH